MLGLDEVQQRIRERSATQYARNIGLRLDEAQTSPAKDSDRPVLTLEEVGKRYGEAVLKEISGVGPGKHVYLLRNPARRKPFASIYEAAEEGGPMEESMLPDSERRYDAVVVEVPRD